MCHKGRKDEAMGSRNEDLIAQWTQDAPTAMPAADFSVAATDPFARPTEADAEWQSIIAHERLTWHTDLTDEGDNPRTDG